MQSGLERLRDGGAVGESGNPSRRDPWIRQPERSRREHAKTFLLSFCNGISNDCFLLNHTLKGFSIKFLCAITVTLNKAESIE